MSNDVSSFFGGEGIPSAKFHTIGDSITGTIVEPPTQSQQTEYGTGKPLTVTQKPWETPDYVASSSPEHRSHRAAA
jgi:hypothetical protein